jgi:curved DNA-binding protein CbpA
MKWQSVLYLFSFGTLVASIVAGVFAPFCRKRQPQVSVMPKEEPPVTPVRKSGEQDRIAHAMRNWSAVRADADLAFAPPPRPMRPEPEPQPAPMCEVSLREVEAPPPPAPADETNHGAFRHETGTIAEPNPFLNLNFAGAPNFYEILQISPRADLDTIHRVYRIMAARFHPDNPVSGDHERFLKLCEAYDVLASPSRREQYDTALRAQESRPIPLFETRIFVDGLDGEHNRRFGILALLYQRRRIQQAKPGISTLELEQRMALPREHLEFTLWYLRNKGYVQILEENSDYAVTSVGVDYVESNSAQNPILRELLIESSEGRPEAATAPPVPLKRSRHNRENRRARREREVTVAR